MGQKRQSFVSPEAIISGDAKRLVVLRIKHGEYEFNSHLIVESSTRANTIAKNFYGDGCGIKDGDGYLFNGDELYVEVRRDMLISEAEAKVIRGCLG